MKKVLLIITIIISAFLITGCIRTRKSAVDFKEEYEKVNNEVMKGDIKYRSLEIRKDNPYIKVDPSEIVKKIENKETFYLYVGDHLCPWCRSGIEKMIDVALENGVKDIYYIDFWDDNHNEILRDVYEVQTIDKKNKVVKTKTEIPEYKEILKAVENFAQDYTITKDDKTYEVGEKRIFGGDHFYFENGECKRYTSLRSDKLNKATDPLTEEVLKDQEENFKKLFTNPNVCNDTSNC